MRKVYIACMPGASSSSGHKGSYFRKTLNQVIKSKLTDDQKDMINLIKWREPEPHQVKKFIRKHNDKENCLLLTGKSYGGARICVDVLKKIYKELEYYKIGLITIDPYGKGYGYQRRKPIIYLPEKLVSTKRFKAYNFYHRNGGLEGAAVKGSINLNLKKFDSGKKVKHMNLVYHPEVWMKTEEVLDWLLI